MIDAVEQRWNGPILKNVDMRSEALEKRAILSQGDFSASR